MGTPKNPPKHMVAITTECCLCEIAPEVLCCLEGESICFQNLSKGDVIVMFPSDKVFGTPRLLLDPGEAAFVQVSVPSGCYPYTAFSMQNMAFANKIARPRIIVYRL